MPPGQSNNPPSTDPYAFITNEPKKKRNFNLFSPQVSFQKRLFIILGGGIVLIILIIIFSSLLSPKTKTTGLVTIGQEQGNLVALSTAASSTVSQQVTKNLAVNIILGLTSDQLRVVSYLNSAGKKVSVASLTTSQATTLSQQLSSAPANTVDSLYVQLVQNLLTGYITTLKQVYSSGATVKQKVLLSNFYNSANLLSTQLNSAAGNI